MELKDLPKQVTQPRGAYAQVSALDQDKERRKRLRVAEAPLPEKEQKETDGA